MAPKQSSNSLKMFFSYKYEPSDAVTRYWSFRYPLTLSKRSKMMAVDPNLVAWHESSFSLRFSMCGVKTYSIS